MNKVDIEITNFLEKLNNKYYNLHKKYEDYFWKTYMGQSELGELMNEALAKRDAFSADRKNLEKVLFYKEKTKTKKLLERLGYWEKFFKKNQMPEKVLKIKDKILILEKKISDKIKNIKEGYIDPETKKFVKMPYLQMRHQMITNKDEKLRKAFFKSGEKRAVVVIKEYIELVKLRNEFAQKLNFEDFYDYKVQNEEGMTKKELFDIFDKIYEKTKYAFENVKEIEKKKKGLRKPWNYHYTLAGSFINESDKYLQLENIIKWWGQSFTSMGIDYADGELKLDLLERKGKYNNGFCHWPKLVKYKNGEKIPASSNFTCNAVVGQVGSGSEALLTLFHEGGHAAHLLNSSMKDVCINHEYTPQSTAWAETQSMFLDTVSTSIEWKNRYAHDKDGNYYPFSLYEKQVEQNHKVYPLAMMGISSTMFFEKEIYETKNLTENKVKQIAKKISDKFFDREVSSLSVLNIPHLYSFESACSYHGYALAEIAVTQWREYFYEKYGYIVDNKNVGKEMKKVWKFGAAKTFAEFVKDVTGKKLSPDAYIKNATKDKDEILKIAKERIEKLSKIKKNEKINLKAKISLWHGTKKIADNKKGFLEMVEKYNKWIDKNM